MAAMGLGTRWRPLAWVGALAAAACGAPEPAFREPMVLGGVEVPADVLERGRRVYMLRCASCHGADGSGQGPSSRTLRRRPADLRAASFAKALGLGEGEAAGDRLPTDAQLTAWIRAGSPETGMPPFAHLPAEDLRAVAQFLKTFSPRWRAHPAPASP